ncbi:two-component system regulatory protein YycI [Alkalibacterium indicireducens]|uniref:Two-component system regulatory protein YycI n=1 Tax=Alkalibacterium indicireducens TaxID=398758 RepID=A0ABN1AKM2_9LACT
MDFKKIENIFLMTFMLLNIYLLISFLNRSDLQSASTAPDQVNLMREMEQIGIDLPNLTEEYREVYYVQADRNNLLEENIDQLENQAGSIAQDGSLYTSILSDPIEIEGNPDDGFTAADYDVLDEFITSGAVLFGSEYAFLRFDNSENRFVYAQIVEGIPVADGTSEISLFYGGDGNIISYQQSYAGPMTTQGSPMEIITDRQAVEVLFQNNAISSNTTVRQPILSYQRTLHLEDLSMYGPIWYIPVVDAGGERVLRVDAIERTIITEPVIPVDPEELDDSED